MKSRLSQIFAGAALGAGVALTSLATAGCALIPGALTATVGSNNPFTGTISAKDAFAYAQADPAASAALSDDQRKIVYIVRQLQKTPLGLEMTKSAADFDYTYAVHNNIRGSGRNFDFFRLIALELIDDGTSGDPAADYTDNIKFFTDAWMFRKILGHELTHLYQGEVWKNRKPPPGLNSFDRKLWKLALEGQAELFANIVSMQFSSAEWNDTGNFDHGWLTSSFSKYMEDDRLHPRSYNIMGARCDDGRAMTAEEFNAAFGNIQGRKDNFLSPVIRTREDIYAIFAKNPLVLEAAKAGGCPMKIR